mmetsp:Transcript_33920/g.33040  ORF Transcript_33920/g.33040 Transcript_33920/m.33040 type:complete len:182 (+) Transcript_33920:218-763(+)
MFQTLFDLVSNSRNFLDLHEKIAELINWYSQSLFIRADCMVQYVLPMQALMLSSQAVTLQTFQIILESLVRILKSQELCLYILHRYDIAVMLNSIIGKEQFALQEQPLSDLELVVKLIFYNPVKMFKSSQLFIHTLLQHSNHNYNKLGLLALHCISLALQEKEFQQNIVLFSEEQILTGIF